MISPTPLIGILADDLDVRIERAVTRALQHAQPRRDRRNAETSRPSKEWLTNREALTYLGISKPTLYRYRASGQVRFSKLGSNVFYRKEDLDALLASGSRTLDREAQPTHDHTAKEPTRRETTAAQSSRAKSTRSKPSTGR